MAPLAARGATYPADPYSCPAEDRWNALETVSRVQPPGNPVQRLAQWDCNELRSAVRNGALVALLEVCLQARQRRRAVLRRHSLPRALAVSVRVANRGQRTYLLRGLAGRIPWMPGSESDCRAWVVNADAPVAPGEERVVRFDLTRLQPDRPCPRTAPAWPTAVNLHVGAPAPGVQYELQLREWTVHYPEAAGVRAASLQVPPTLAPRTETRFALGRTACAPGRP